MSLFQFAFSNFEERKRSGGADLSFRNRRNALKRRCTCVRLFALYALWSETLLNQSHCAA